MIEKEKERNEEKANADLHKSGHKGWEGKRREEKEREEKRREEK